MHIDILQENRFPGIMTSKGLKIP